MTTPPTPILRLTDIHRRYNVGTEIETEVLHGISLALEQAEFVALKGPSGSGKSTLLNIIGLGAGCGRDSGAQRMDPVPALWA